MVRKVPISFTSEGITLVVLPPWKLHMDKTEGVNGLLLRLTICCSPTTMLEAVKIVSAVKCGDFERWADGTTGAADAVATDSKPSWKYAGVLRGRGQ